MHAVRPVLVVVLAATLGACGGSAASTTTHRIPGYTVSVAVPGTWSAVDYRATAEELARFETEHPRYPGVADQLRNPDAGSEFVAATKGGDTRLLLSISKVSSDYTVRRSIRANVQELEAASTVTIYGDHEEIVKLSGAGEAWRIRWSAHGEQGVVQILQYTFIRNGLGYLFTYSTLKRYDEVSNVFDTSARSIRIGSPPTSTTAESEGLIAFQSDRAENDHFDIYVMNTDGAGQHRLTRTGADYQPAWSPDGRRIAFASKRDGNAEVYVMDADGSDQSRLTHAPEADTSPAWSRDGRELLFARGDCDDEKCDVFVMNADGHDVRRLTRDGHSLDASWSPDGRKIVFWSGRDYGSAIWLMNSDGSDQRNLTPEFDASWGPDWSPDGKTLLFVSTGKDDAPAIYGMQANGSDRRRIAYATGYWIDEPEWSPDGKRITFFSDALGPGTIWVMNADGTQQRALTTTGDDHSPSWQPSSDG